MRILLKSLIDLIAVASIGGILVQSPIAANWNPLPDTGQIKCYGPNDMEINCPAEGQPLHGQDAHYSGPTPTYRDNGNGTVSDLNTGLMWQQSNDGIDRNWFEAIDFCPMWTWRPGPSTQSPTKFELQSTVHHR